MVKVGDVLLVDMLGISVIGPIASMYGIFTYMYHNNQPKVG